MSNKNPEEKQSLAAAINSMSRSPRRGLVEIDPDRILILTPPPSCLMMIVQNPDAKVRGAAMEKISGTELQEAVEWIKRTKLLADSEAVEVERAVQRLHRLSAEIESPRRTLVPDLGAFVCLAASGAFLMAYIIPALGGDWARVELLAFAIAAGLGAPVAYAASHWAESQDKDDRRLARVLACIFAGVAIALGGIGLYIVHQRDTAPHAEEALPPPPPPPPSTAPPPTRVTGPPPTSTLTG